MAVVPALGRRSRRSVGRAAVAAAIVAAAVAAITGDSGFALGSQIPCWPSVLRPQDGRQASVGLRLTGGQGHRIFRTVASKRIPASPSRPLAFQQEGETSSDRDLLLPAGVHTAVNVFLEIFVYSTLLMSFSLASLVPFVQLECGGATSLDWRPFWVGATESIAVYTLDHLRDMRRLGVNSVGRGKPILLTALLLTSLAGFGGILLGSRSWRVAATFWGHLALCASYTKLKQRMPYMKAFYVSLCVVFLATAGPAAFFPSLLSGLSWALLGRLALLIFCVAFSVEHLQDLRDVQEDQEAGVVTWPSGLGEARARRWLLAVQGLCLMLHGALTWVASLPVRLDFIGIYAVCGLCAVSFSKRTPRSLFQVILEPLYAAPLIASVARRAFLGG